MRVGVRRSTLKVDSGHRVSLDIACFVVNYRELPMHDLQLALASQTRRFVLATALPGFVIGETLVETEQ